MTTLVLLFATIAPAVGDDRAMIPQQLPKEQQDNLARFLDSHQKADRYIPEGAKIVGTLPGGGELPPAPPAAKPVKQYTVQIISHRPVPDQPEPSRVDVYYYRPNPEPRSTRASR